jgi:acyl-CoA thioester hydrolase
MSEFRWPVRVYYEDTDAGGVVYHAGYVRWFERARTEWLRSLGWSLARVAEEQKVLFSVVSMDVRYHLPARLDDLLEVVTRPQLGGGASLEFEQQVLRDGQLLASGRVLVACVDAVTFKPRRLPTEFRTRIA